MLISRIYVPEGRMTDRPGLLDAWPFTIPSVRELVGHGLSLDSQVTFLVGENGSGKSTILEAIAEAYGLDVRGGHGGRRYDNRPPKGELSPYLQLERTSAGLRMTGRNTKGFFLRAETAYGVFKFMSDHGVSGYGVRHLEEVSHGESFLQVADGRFTGAGLYLLDEPESALSFQSCLALMGVIERCVAQGAQFICATHSPVLCALPHATIYELSEHGVQRKVWSETALVERWRSFMDKPGRYVGQV